MGAASYVILWLLGIPFSVLLLIWIVSSLIGR
jgi:hypothetical protein